MRLSARQANRETTVARDKKWGSFLISVDDTIQRAVLNGDYTCNIWAPNSDFARRIIFSLELDDYKVEPNFIEPKPFRGNGSAQDAQCLTISWE